MREQEIKVFPIAKTSMNGAAVREWLDSVGAEEYPEPRTKPWVNGDGPQEPEITDAGAVIGLAAKRCYMSFEPGLNPNVTRVRKNWHKYLNNILKSGHGSVLEHSSWTWAIEGVTRVFTAEMNRHRAGVAISEGSLRYIRFDDVPFWMPKSLDEDSQFLQEMCTKCQGIGLGEGGACTTCKGTGYSIGEYEFTERKQITREVFREQFRQAEEAYKRLCFLWDINEGNFQKKKHLTSMFRRIIPMGVSTGGVWTMNMRALRHIITLRTHPAAEEEIVHVIGLIAKTMCESEPALFGDFVNINGQWMPKNLKV